MYGMILGITFIIAGGVVMWVAKKAQDETLPLNYWAGIRTNRTMASDDAWRVGHKAAAPWILLAGALTFIAGIACAFMPDDIVTWISFAVVVLLVGPLLIGTWKANRAIESL